MNALTTVKPPDLADVAINLTAIMEAEGILRIARIPDAGSYTVYLEGNRMGGGKTVGEALRNARGRS